MSIVLTVVYWFNKISAPILMPFILIEREKKSKNFAAKMIIISKNNTGTIPLPYFKLYSVSTVTEQYGSCFTHVYTLNHGI